MPVGLARRAPPLAPMRRPDVEPFFGACLHPAVGNAAAGKDERMHAAAIIDDGELEISVEWCGRNVLPHCAIVLQHERAPH